MSTYSIDLTMLGERLTRVRQMYGETVDLPNLGPTLFAVLLGASVLTYESYERGEREPTVDFLVALRKQTGVCLDWLLDPNPSGLDHSFR